MTTQSQALRGVFGSRIPSAFHDDVNVVNSIELGALRTIVGRIENLSFAESPVTSSTFEKRVTEATREVGVPEGSGLSVARLYGTVVTIGAGEPGSDSLTASLETLGIERSRAQVLSESIFRHRPKIDAELVSSLKERFGPVLSKLYWRVDKPVAGTPPFLGDPVGVVGLILETATETYDERFEVDLSTLDFVIDELSRLRKELSNATNSTDSS